MVLNYEPEQIGGLVAIGLTIAAGIWRARLRMRRDIRLDDQQEISHDAYASTIKWLREEVGRLAETVETLSAQIDEERKARWDVESEAARLRVRVSELENVLAKGAV